MAIAKTKEQAIEIANQILTHLGVSELHDINKKPTMGDGYNIYLSPRTFNQNTLIIRFHVQPAMSGMNLNVSIESKANPDSFRDRNLKPASLQKAISSIEKVIDTHNKLEAAKKEMAEKNVAIAAKLKAFTDSLAGEGIEGVKACHYKVSDKACASVTLAGGNEIRLSIENDVLISKVFKLNIEKQGEERAIELIKTVRKLELI